MSKSYGNTIALMADPDVIKDTIRRIVTDSTPPDQPKDPDACTLTALLRAFGDDSTVQEVETRYRNGTIGYGEAKARLAEVIEGERRAARRADQVLTRAMTAMGL